MRVALNGCFDRLHSGHLFLLGNAYARANGGDIIVGINSDDYIKRHKRLEHMCEKTRTAHLLGTGIVDAVHVFNDDDPREFIRRSMPDLYIIGEEYKDKAVEEELLNTLGIPIVYVPRVGKWSTTNEYKEDK